MIILCYIVLSEISTRHNRVLTTNKVDSPHKGVIKLELSNRKEQILSAVIEHFIATGEPAGSKYIAEVLPVPVSSATIRNEMADLSEMGFLTQPHTSAGRIPSDRAYRYYIEKLLLNYTPSDSDMFRISSSIDSAEGDPREVLAQACTVLSELTGCTAIATSHSDPDAGLTGTRIFPVSENSVMTVVTTTSGALKSRITRCDAEPGYEILQLFYNTVKANFSDRKIGDITTASVQSACAALGNRAIEIIPYLVSFYECINDILSGDVIVKGAQNALYASAKIGDAAGISRLLYNEEELIRLFSVSSDRKIELKIGTENEYQCLHGFSLIKVAYGTNGKSCGSIGIMAPTKTEYSEVIPLIKYTAETLTDVFAHGTAAT